MFPQLGLKASSDPAQIEDRLKYHPQTFEFFTDVHNFTPAGLAELKAGIRSVQGAGIDQIVIHQPMKFGDIHSELAAPQTAFPDLYDFIERSTAILLELASEFDLQILVHGGYSGDFPRVIPFYPSLEAAQAAVLNRLDRFQELGGTHIMFENSISEFFAYGNPVTERAILDHGYRLAFDTSHCFIYLHGDNDALCASLAKLKDRVVHYHLVDSMGQSHDSLPLGTGKIDWARVWPLLNPRATNIYEINLADQTDCQEQLASHRYLTGLIG